MLPVGLRIAAHARGPEGRRNRGSARIALRGTTHACQETRGWAELDLLERRVVEHEAPLGAVARKAHDDHAAGLQAQHDALTEALERVDAGFLRLNLLLLLLVAFLPFPTRVMEEYLRLTDAEHGGERTAVAFFGIVLFLMSLMLIVLGKYAEREGLFGDDAAEERQEERRVTYQLAPSLVFYGVATVLGLAQPYVGLVLYVLIGVYLLLPVKTVRRLLRRRG